MPLFDAYAAAARAENLDNPRLNPIVASLDTLPENMLFIGGTIDILLHEQLTFIEKLKGEVAQNGKYAGRRVESLMFDGQIHGFLECELNFRHFCDDGLLIFDSTVWGR
jgi:acetyl esterase/lipase